jgi:multidrug efflux pump subunit AcrA (membrane-fusion protein)
VERLRQQNSALQREKAASEQELRQELADARLLLDRTRRPSSVGGVIGTAAKLMFANAYSNRPYSKVNKSTRAKVAVIFSLPV